MKKFFADMKLFDKTDWGFFTGLMLMGLFTLFLAWLSLVTGAPFWVPVLFVLVFLVNMYGTVKASLFAIETQKYIKGL